MITGGFSAPDPFVFGEFPNVAPGNQDTNGKTLRASQYPNSGEATGVFIIAGQSNAGNCALTSNVPAHASKVDNLSIYDGAVYAGADPLLGCQNIAGVDGKGNLFTRMADKLIAAGKYQRVVLIPCAIGGTGISDHLTYLSQRPIVGARRASARGFSVTAVLWMQGENDTVWATTQAAYLAGITQLIGFYRAAGFNSPWLIGKCSWIAGAGSAAVRAAQGAIVNNSDIFAGADSDAYTGLTYRQTGDTHLNDAGQNAVATDWAAKVQAYL